ncbi:MAG: YigZ family protein [Paludibacter sp.]|jgi:uncharacterized YigZ family protein|nr:YigZ family protein [Paludibacter sp.]
MNLNGVYRSIKSLSTGIYKEKGSKFLSFALPVSSGEEAKEIIKQYKKQYHDARHVCSAYMLGSERLESKANDDGEPSGTAGRPILGQINSFGLSNILIIVVRYFGGILLGTGGLVQAYKQAACEALQNAEIIEKNEEIEVEFEFNYLKINDIMSAIKKYEVNIVAQEYKNDFYKFKTVVQKKNNHPFVSEIKEFTL